MGFLIHSQYSLIYFLLNTKIKDDIVWAAKNQEKRPAVPCAVFSCRFSGGLVSYRTPTCVQGGANPIWHSALGRFLVKNGRVFRLLVYVLSALFKSKAASSWSSSGGVSNACGFRYSSVTICSESAQSLSAL